MRVLITNNTLDTRAGSELWVRDIALALLRRGHQPIAYSRRLGAVAEELRCATVPVLDDLASQTEPPDLIHGHHHLETMTALLRFPGVPALSVCHGWLPPEEAPPAFPRILRYIAVDDLVRERLIIECGIPEGLVRTVRNFVDLERFRPRAPLPPLPARALLFSNNARDDDFASAVRQGCAAAGIPVDVAGKCAGAVADRPETLLPRYDVVFAKGRSALEAAAVGCFVVLCDASGLGPPLTPANFDEARALNLGLRMLREPIRAEAVRARLVAYDPRAAREVQARVRAEAGLDEAVDRLLSIYHEVLAEGAARKMDPLDDLRAASRYLRWGPLRGGETWAAERERLAIQRDRLAAERDRLVAERDQFAAGLARGQDEELASLRRELAVITGSASWRWRQRLLHNRILVGMYRRLRGLPVSSTAAQPPPTGHDPASSSGERAAPRSGRNRSNG
jgi:Glycosyltransferase Family 4